MFHVVLFSSALLCFALPAFVLVCVFFMSVSSSFLFSLFSFLFSFTNYKSMSFRKSGHRQS